MERFKGWPRIGENYKFEIFVSGHFWVLVMMNSNLIKSNCLRSLLNKTAEPYKVVTLCYAVSFSFIVLRFRFALFFIVLVHMWTEYSFPGDF